LISLHFYLNISKNFNIFKNFACLFFKSDCKDKKPILIHQTILKLFATFFLSFLSHLKFSLLQRISFLLASVWFQSLKEHLV